MLGGQARRSLDENSIRSMTPLAQIFLCDIGLRCNESMAQKEK